MLLHSLYRLLKCNVPLGSLLLRTALLAGICFCASTQTLLAQDGDNEPAAVATEDDETSTDSSDPNLNIDPGVDINKPLPPLEVPDPEPQPPRPPASSGTSLEGGIRTAPIPRKPESAAELLEYFDIDESLLRQLIDGRPVHDDEKEAIVRILFALPKLPADYLHNWTEESPNWEEIIENPQDFRTKIYHLQGQVTRVEKIQLIPEAAARFDFTHYYQATIELGEDRWKATVCSRRVPLDWKIGEPINESASFRGLLLKMGDGPVFATTRIAWHPNRLDEETGITRSHVILGDLGMDVGLWDDVRDRRPLLPGDREAFYQLMHSMARIRQERLREQATPTDDFADIIRHPRDYHGQMLTFQGVARRCAKIIVSDSDIRARFGIEHYYEIYLIIDLERKIVYKDDGTGKSVEFQTFPIAICERELPPGMPEGDDINEAVSISGVFFKLWEYDSRKMTAFNVNQEQPCPMLFTLRPDLLEPPSASPYIGITVGGMFIVALLGVWISVWCFGREDAAFAQSTLKRQYELEKGTSLDEIGLTAGGAPDFSHLSAAAAEAELEAPSSDKKSISLSASVRQQLGQWISERTDPDQMQTYLLEHGYEESQIESIYGQLGYTPRELRKRHRQAQHNRRIGAVLIGVGAVMGGLSAFFQAGYGAGVVICFGVMGYGLVMMLTGENHLAQLFHGQGFVKKREPDVEH